MSYRTWTTRGFGICVDDIPAKDVTFEKIKKLCSLSSEAYKEFLKDILEYVEDDLDPDTLYRNMPEAEMYEAVYNKAVAEGDIEEFLEKAEVLYGERGLTFYLKGIIKDVEGIELVWADNFNCTNYLLLTPHYSWSEISEKERNMTEEEAVNYHRP